MVAQVKDDEIQSGKHNYIPAFCRDRSWLMTDSENPALSIACDSGQVQRERERSDRQKDKHARRRKHNKACTQHVDMTVSLWTGPKVMFTCEALLTARVMLTYKGVLT